MQLDGYLSKIVPKGKVEFGLAVDEFQMGGIFMQNWGEMLGSWVAVDWKPI